MDLNELWVGDWVMILSSGTKGKFEGVTANGMAKIKTKNGYVSAVANDLQETEAEIYQAPEIVSTSKTKIDTKKQGLDLQESLAFNREFDLHIDRLTDYNPNNWPMGELDFQLYKCRSFLNEAIRLRVPRVVLIHGIGQGILKENIQHLLTEFVEVNRTNDANDGGATEVWLEY